MDVLLVMGLIGLSVLLLYAWVKQKRKDSEVMSRYLMLSGETRENLTSDKGVQGEFAIYKALHDMGAGGHVLVNLYVPYRGGTSEIDLVWVHRTGVYVIESKNYSGNVYGSEYTKNWVQYLGGQKFPFYNPIQQNRTHINALAVAGIPETYMHSIIVFGSKATLQKVEVSNNEPPVLTLDQLASYCRKKVRSSKDVYTDDDVTSVANGLFNTYALASEHTKAQHIERIQRKYGTIS